MIIIVKDYTWTQSEMTINIKVPVSSAYHEKVDFFTSDSYIKAHFSPFLFEVFLLHDIDNKKSKCVVKDDLIIMDLVKKEAIQWTNLYKDLTKDEKKIIRQEILEKSQEQAKQEAEDKRVKKSQLDRFTVQQAMDIDSKQHSLMDARRDDERNKAMADLESWRTSNCVEESHKPLPIKYHTGSAKIVELSPSDDENEGTKNETKSKAPVKVTERKKEFKPAKKLIKSEYVEKKKEESKKRVLPRLRVSGLLEIKHTPRTFPTPSRESTEREEQAWLKNITLARRATGFMSEDLRPEEQDPQWCKVKGDEFFRNGNFLGAISAYTHGITMSDKLPSLYSNRAATHFALGNFNKCINDCSTALELMKPPCEGNRRSRAKCIARRGAALARCGYMSKGIDEMKAAAKLLPDDEAIKTDIYNMERAWEQNPD